VFHPPTHCATDLNHFWTFGPGVSISDKAGLLTINQLSGPTYHIIQVADPNSLNPSFDVGVTSASPMQLSGVRRCHGTFKIANNSERLTSAWRGALLVIFRRPSFCEADRLGSIASRNGPWLLSVMVRSTSARPLAGLATRCSVIDACNADDRACISCRVSRLMEACRCLRAWPWRMAVRSAHLCV